jgi:hypothetical protein
MQDRLHQAIPTGGIIDIMENEFSVRRAGIGDLNSISALYKAAIEAMEKEGIHQWDDLYPDEDVLTEDVLTGNMFLVETGGRIISAFVINQCADGYDSGPGAPAAHSQFCTGSAWTLCFRTWESVREPSA